MGEQVTSDSLPRSSTPDHRTSRDREPGGGRESLGQTDPQLRGPDPSDLDAGARLAHLDRELSVLYPEAGVAQDEVLRPTRCGRQGQRRRQLIGLVVVGVVVAGVPLTMNTLKYGNPLQTGYMLIYEGRDDSFATDAHEHGLFSPYFLPRNLYYMNLGFPRLHRIEMAGQTEYHLVHNGMGTGIWWTTPLLLWLWFDLRRILGDRATRGLLAAAIIVFVGLMFFHTTGEEQRGYNRFSLDFLPILLAVIAPTCFAGRRRWISAAMVAWSVVYFRWLV